MPPARRNRPALRLPLLALAFCFAALLAQPAPALAAPPIRSTADVNVRVAPNLSGGIIRQLPSGSTATIRCAIQGQQIYDTNVWFYSDFGENVYGFWSAYYSDATFTTWADLLSRYNLRRCDRYSPAIGGSVYYQPRYTVDDPKAPLTTFTATKDFWAPGNCSAANAADWPAFFDDKQITRASGWSLGRLGITYLLAGHPTRAQAIQQIVLFDPGSLEDYQSECDQRYDQDTLIADWLRGNANRRLLVLAGAVTRDTGHPDAQGRFHQGIQQHLFPAIRQAGLQSRVLVCNYDNMSHKDVMKIFGWLAASGSVTSCPTAENVRPDASWRP